MKRILVADDERPVVDGISHIVRRDLSAEFEIAGTASSGREAVEKAVLLAPDLVLMDVRMPGLSGLDAVRELRARGSRASVILITAYERFDIAREAVELGVLDYLLKPVSKDSLARSLRSALALIERKAEAEKREIEGRERAESMRGLAEAAFLQSLMLGERSAAEMEKYRSALGIPEPFGLAAAVAVVPPPGAVDPEAEASALYEALKLSLRYKTRAIAGPLTKGLGALFFPLRDESEAPAAADALRAVIEAGHEADLARGRLALGCGSARPFAEAFASWSEALADLLGASCPGRPGLPEGLSEASFDDDAAFLEALASASPERASLALERILFSLRGRDAPSTAERHRVASLFGEAARELRRRGALSGPAVAEAMDLSDLLSAASATELVLASRSRFSSLAAASLAGPRRTTALDAAIARIKKDFGRPLTLDLVADELGISAARLSRLFVEGTGRGFSDFLIEYRIERAKEMLLEPEAAIKQVSVACGYPDPNYFSRLFKKVTGVTPSAFSSGTREASNENR
jgi:two-component system response regulator YesN